MYTNGRYRNTRIFVVPVIKPVPNWVILGLSLFVISMTGWLVADLWPIDPGDPTGIVVNLDDPVRAPKLTSQEAQAENWEIILNNETLTDEPVRRLEGAITFTFLLDLDLQPGALCREGYFTDCEVLTQNPEHMLNWKQATEIVVKAALGTDYSPPDGNWFWAFDLAGFDRRGHTLPDSAVTWGDIVSWMTHARKLNPTP